MARNDEAFKEFAANAHRPARRSSDLIFSRSITTDSAVLAFGRALSSERGSTPHVLSPDPRQRGSRRRHSSGI
jgi:hypothetical protein